MTTDLGPLMSLAALAVSAAVGGITTWLALGKRTEEAGLAADTDRILGESRELRADVAKRRRDVEPRIQSLSAVEIEAVIATAYHGKRMAEAQLERTLLSKHEVLKEYGLFDRPPAPGTPQETP